MKYHYYYVQFFKAQVNMTEMTAYSANECLVKSYQTFYDAAQVVMNAINTILLTMLMCGIILILLFA